MPKWVNINEEQPTQQQNYYVKISKRKDIMDLGRLCKYADIADDVFWLDEKRDNDAEIISVIKEKDFAKLNQFNRETVSKALRISTESKPIELINRIAKDTYDFSSVSNLEKIFGIKRGKKIEKLLFNIKVSKIKNKKQ